jgi:hypothetical protein
MMALEPGIKFQKNAGGKQIMQQTIKSKINIKYDF